MYRLYVSGLKVANPPGPPPDRPTGHKVSCNEICQRNRWLWHAQYMPLHRQRLALLVTSLLFLLLESESLGHRPGSGPALNLNQVDSVLLMPPRTIIRCPGCSRVFATEKGLNNHRAHPSNRHLPCFLRPDLGARISSWGDPGGRVETVDLESTYGMGLDRSPSPDPGDDMNTPEDFNEDDLGGPEPASPVPPPVLPQVYVPIRSNTYQYTYHTTYQKHTTVHTAIHAMIRTNTCIYIPIHAKTNRQGADGGALRVRQSA